MLLSLLYNSPIWSDMDLTSRLLRVIVTGLICYVLIHSYLYSAYVESNELVLKYRNYVIYLAGVDLLAVLALYYTSKPKKKKRVKQKTKRQMMNDISPDIQKKAQQEYEMIRLRDLQQRADVEHPKRLKTDDDKNKELFVTQDEITTNSIPVYKSTRKETDSIPVYHPGKVPQRGVE